MNENDVVSFMAEMVERLVDAPGSVRVTAETSEIRTVIAVRVAQADIGRVIGRKGQTACALRAILEASTRREGKRYELDIQRGESR